MQTDILIGGQAIPGAGLLEFLLYWGQVSLAKQLLGEPLHRHWPAVERGLVFLDELARWVGEIVEQPPEEIGPGLLAGNLANLLEQSVVLVDCYLQPFVLGLESVDVFAELLN